MPKPLTNEQKTKARLLAGIEDLRAAAFNVGDDHGDREAAASLIVCQREIEKALKAYTFAVRKAASKAAGDDCCGKLQ
jgi:hypothetical protein